MRRRTLAVIVCGLALFIGEAYYLIEREDDLRRTRAKVEMISSAGAPVRSQVRGSAVRGPARSQPAAPVANLLRHIAVDAAKVQAEQDQAGCLSQLRQNPGNATRAPKGYSSTDPKSFLPRAKELMDLARGALCSGVELSAEGVVWNAGAYSTEVVFRQSVGGVTLSPAGTVTVMLGAHGELVGLYSEAQPGVRGEGQFRLSSEEAKEIARGTTASSAPRVHGGMKVMWMPPGGARVARAAYQFMVSGYEIVVDAETGEVLSKRDRRNT